LTANPGVELVLLPFGLDQNSDPFGGISDRWSLAQLVGNVRPLHESGPHLTVREGPR
jgi:hypothetical protein